MVGERNIAANEASGEWHDVLGDDVFEPRLCDADERAESLVSSERADDALGASCSIAPPPPLGATIGGGELM